MATTVRTFKRGLAGVGPRLGRVRLANLRLGPAAQILVVLAVVVSLIAAGAWTLYQRAHRAELVGQARSAAIPAARSHAEELLSYDHRTLKNDLSQAKADTTGSFREEYLNTTKKLVSAQAKKYEVVVRARVVGTSVVQAEPDRVVALLFVNQATQSNRIKGTEIDQNRVRMTLRKVDGKWLVANLGAL